MIWPLPVDILPMGVGRFRGGIRPQETVEAVLSDRVSVSNGECLHRAAAGHEKSLGSCAESGPQSVQISPTQPGSREAQRPTTPEQGGVFSRRCGVPRRPPSRSRCRPHAPRIAAVLDQKKLG